MIKLTPRLKKRINDGRENNTKKKKCCQVKKLQLKKNA